MGLNAKVVPGEYPEHEKLDAIKNLSQAINDFLDWAAEEEDLVLCEPGDLTQYGEPSAYRLPTFISHKTLLARHFDIDLDRLEAEKRAMLDAIRS